MYLMVEATLLHHFSCVSIASCCSLQGNASHECDGEPCQCSGDDWDCYHPAQKNVSAQVFTSVDVRVQSHHQCVGGDVHLRTWIAVIIDAMGGRTDWDIL